MASFDSPLSKKVRELRSLRFERAAADNRARWSQHDLEREEWAEQARLLNWQVIDLEQEIGELQHGMVDLTQYVIGRALEGFVARTAQQSFWRPTLNY